MTNRKLISPIPPVGPDRDAWFASLAEVLADDILERALRENGQRPSQSAVSKMGAETVYSMAHAVTSVVLTKWNKAEGNI